MALYIQIRKLDETIDAADYEFLVEADPARRGVAQISKQSGEVTLITAAAGDEEGRFFSRVARKLYLHHQEGQYPEITGWAS